MSYIRKGEGSHASEVRKKRTPPSLSGKGDGGLGRVLRKRTKAFQKSLETRRCGEVQLRPIPGEFRPADEDGIQVGSGCQNPEPTPKYEIEIPI